LLSDYGYVGVICPIVQTTTSGIRQFYNLLPDKHFLSLVS